MKAPSILAVIAAATGPLSAGAFSSSSAFAVSPSHARRVLETDVSATTTTTTAAFHRSSRTSASATPLFMALDPVTYLRTEWVSASLCTNQTPRDADVCLQLGLDDGRVANLVPRTIREIITSSVEAGGEGLSLSSRRSLKEMAERRGTARTITYSDQPADDLRDTADRSVDVVLSLQVAERMHENGLDWKRSIREAARVLKPGGRFLFVEAADIDGESFLDYIQTVTSDAGDGGESESEESADGEGDGVEGNGEDTEATLIPVFDDVGFDDVDMVLVPHVAGVAIKALDADLSPTQRFSKENQDNEDAYAEKSFDAFERGNKRRRRKKKKKDMTTDGMGRQVPTDDATGMGK